MKYPLSPALLAQGIAYVGKTGTGKTTSAKGGIESVLHAEETARVCILDPIKSDWWGLTSSASGKRPGFPFQILGGPHGHVPLHHTAGEVLGGLVGRGELPLSIIDMANFPMGGLQSFFSDFADSLMRSMRGVLYLVLEEAHEFAPKERSGVGGENMAVYWAKKLATAGRSRGIRLMVVTQRTQKLHNDLLGSCETLVAHKLKAPADQKPVKDWLKDNCDDETFKKVSASLGKLRRGTAWVCSDEAMAAEPTAFPLLTTFDNTATPDSADGVHHVTTAPVDRAKLASILGDALEELEANDVDKLKARIKVLEAEKAKAPPAAMDPAELERVRRDGFIEGARAGVASKKGRFEAIAGKVSEITAIIELALEQAERGLQAELKDTPTPSPAAVPRPVSPPPVAVNRDARPPAEGLSAPQQAILDSLAWLGTVGSLAANRVRVAFLCCVSHKSSGFENNLGALKTRGLIVYPGPGMVSLTDAGHTVARAPERPLTNAELHASLRAKLPAPQWAILAMLIESYPSVRSREAIAERCNVSPKSSGFENNLGALKSLGFISYPSKGHAVALPVLFVEGR